MSGRKRKAEQISAGESANADASLHLPPPVWGHVLDFMPYEEVRSALLVGKLIAVEAVKHVQTLNITSSSHMYIPAARRFANTEEVNVFCLVQGTGDIDQYGDESIALSVETLESIPTFLTSFAKLKEAFLGGMALEQGQMNPTTYFDSICTGPDNHEELFRNLAASIFAARKTGALGREVKVVGLGLSIVNEVWPCSQGEPCQRCRKFIQYLPVDDLLLATINADVEFFCLGKDDFWKLLLKRPGIHSDISLASEVVLCRYVLRYLSRVKTGQLVEIGVKDLRKKWGAERDMPVKVWQVPTAAFVVLDELIGRGLDPAQIRQEYFLKIFGPVFGVSHEEYILTFYVWKQSFVEDLASRGFPLNTDIIPCIEDQFCK